MKKQIVGIFVCMLLILTAVPIISGSGNEIVKILNNSNMMSNENSEPGMINPVWISYVEDYELFDDIRVYENHVYVSGCEWDLEEEKDIPIVCKIDTADGGLTWKTRLALFEDPARAYDIEVLDQGVYVVGYLEDTNDYFLCKLDFNGDISWYKIITHEEHQIIYGIATDNTYLYLCGKKSFNQNPRIIKMDTDGNEIWDKTYTPGYIIDEIVIDNGFIYGVGSRGNPQDFVLMKIDFEGNQIWNRTCGGPEVNIASGITVKDGYVYAIGLGGYDFIVKYDVNGEFQWETNAGIHANGNDVVIHDGYAYTTGQIYSLKTWWEVVLCKYDLDSNLISYLTGPPSSSGRDLEIYDGYLYLSSFDYVLKYDMYQNPDNNKPNKPSRPSGRTNIRTFLPYSFTSTATDPDNNLINYDFSWGDGHFSFMRWYDSGETVKASHIWWKRGNYEVKVRARDEFGMVSEWSDPLSINLPHDKATYRPLLQFLEKYLHTFHLFRYIIGL